MIIILKTLVDIYKPQTHPDVLPKIIKRNVECKKSFESNAISVEQYIKPNGDISKKWCNIKEGDSYYRVNHSFDYIQNLISSTFIYGFKRWDNKIK